MCEKVFRICKKSTEKRLERKLLLGKEILTPKSRRGCFRGLPGSCLDPCSEVRHPLLAVGVEWTEIVLCLTPLVMSDRRTEFDECGRVGECAKERVD